MAILQFPVEAQEIPLSNRLARLAEALRQQSDLNNEIGNLEQIIAEETAAIGDHYPAEGTTLVTPGAVAGGGARGASFPGADQLIRLERIGGVFTAELVSPEEIARANPAPPRPIPGRRLVRLLSVPTS